MLKQGDIVKYEDSPCEVISLCPEAKPQPLVFIINKRTLNGSFVDPSKVEFVRRPVKEKVK